MMKSSMLRTVFRHLISPVPSESGVDERVWTSCEVCRRRIRARDCVHVGFFWKENEVDFGIMCASHYGERTVRPVNILARKKVRPGQYTVGKLVCLHNQTADNVGCERITLSGNLWAPGVGVRIAFGERAYIAARFDDQSRFRGIGIFSASTCEGKAHGPFKILDFEMKGGNLSLLVPRIEKRKKVVAATA